ncbi:gamete antigen 27/25 [Plasmodium brasilianum]|uniref:Gamete antigen 27/25 (G27/25) n=2 Tax=Plasmodium (Plasmodium) TaxID=418103 RepID=A0A1A8WIF5_PLAMA|nr:gamete antigen 27/25, putative [Plasmodium malariae]KAI4834590.1 gamete antigen 27/25 [Plasmodium brasilianum]SBS92708.1 gamete antigen 27/25 (G27/25) [Plasmodium malariae]SCP03128.1 gamete antigen 27/25, putative [Plasmodium malariae]
MNIYIFLQIQIFVICVLIKCASGSIYLGESIRSSLGSEEVNYEYNYEHYKNGPVREEIKKWLDVEFHASTDVLYYLLRISKHKWNIFYDILFTSHITNAVRKFEEMYSFRFIDENARQSCVSRIKGRLLYFLRQDYITEEYCKQIQKYFWIEERLEEEMSVKVDKAKTIPEKKNVCNDYDEMKRVISVYEKGTGVKLTDDIIHFTLSLARGFLLDLLKAEGTVVPSTDLLMNRDDDTSPEKVDSDFNFNREFDFDDFYRV